MSAVGKDTCGGCWRLLDSSHWRLGSHHSHHQFWPSVFHVHFQATGMGERLWLRLGMVWNVPSVKKRLRSTVKV